jgi:hypothetical protein
LPRGPSGYHLAHLLQDSSGNGLDVCCSAVFSRGHRRPEPGIHFSS